MNNGLIFTTDNCIGCNKCVRICTSPGASVSNLIAGKTVIGINRERCIACGACFEICDHDARNYHDDTERFFADLETSSKEEGEGISLLVAPSFAASFPELSPRVLGGLKKLGIRRIIPVSLGADICTWAYLKCIREKGLYGKISTPCPVVVGYVERCLPELIPALMPVLSPMLCTAVYCRKVLGIQDRFVFIGPCIAKRLEMDAHPGLVEYNVTFERLLERFKEKELYGEPANCDMDFGLGSYYPAPGGLEDNVKWFLGDDLPVWTVSGKRYIYRWLENEKQRFSEEDPGFALVDALNCYGGCVEGNTHSPGKKHGAVGGISQLNRIRRERKSEDPASPWNPELTPEERLENLDRQFAGLSLEDYLCEFRDLHVGLEIKVPTPREEEDIWLSMYKPTDRTRSINCAACGYESCREMMLAIHNGFNTRFNCIYFRKEESLRLERMSHYDRMTGALNRNALEVRVSSELNGKKSLGIVLADVNGLKKVNDKLGHLAGDRLIVGTARALIDSFGQDNVYRLGGDEFIVILQDCYPEELNRGIQRAKEQLEKEEIYVACGRFFRESPLLLEGVYNREEFKLMQDWADKDMYRDKEEYYRALGLERR